MATATTVTARLMDPKLIKTHDLSFFTSPNRENGIIHLSSISTQDDNSVESQTLQLFPTRRKRKLILQEKRKNKKSNRDMLKGNL